MRKTLTLAALAALAALSALALTGCNRAEVEQYARADYDACIQQEKAIGITGPVAAITCRAKAEHDTQAKYGVAVSP